MASVIYRPRPVARTWVLTRLGAAVVAQRISASGGGHYAAPPRRKTLVGTAQKPYISRGIVRAREGSRCAWTNKDRDRARARRADRGSNTTFWRSSNGQGLKPTTGYTGKIENRVLSDTGAWTNVAPLPQSVFGGAAATDGTYAYVFGGYNFPEDPGSTLDTVYRYNLATDTWTQLASMPNAALVASAVLPDDEQDLRLRGLDADSRPADRLRRDADLRHRDQHVDDGSGHAGPAQPDGIRLQPRQREDLPEWRLCRARH